MKLAPQVLRKFEESPIHVRTLNGTHREASIRFSYGQAGYGLMVERTHPLMKEIRGLPDKNTFVIFTSRSMNSGLLDSVPSQLAGVVQTLYEAARMPDEKALESLALMNRAMTQSMRQLGITID